MALSRSLLVARLERAALALRVRSIARSVLGDLRGKLQPFYSESGRPSIDPELMMRMLMVGYCYGIRFERKLCEEVKLMVLPPRSR